MVAAMLEQLRPPEGGSVLEIGAGTGYNAALLSALVGASGRVVSIDIDPEVADEARSHLAEAGAANVEVICGDGAQGWAGRAPYDGIIVTAGASDLAPAWVSQLAPGGRLVMPLSIRGVQQCVALTRPAATCAAWPCAGASSFRSPGPWPTATSGCRCPGIPACTSRRRQRRTWTRLRSPTPWGIGGQPRTRASR
jgi:protein-L-isoaspartate(D-aspartate) O-methyltransferase